MKVCSINKMKYFFELLQVALGNRAFLSGAPTSEEWEVIYRLATEQSVLGLVLAGIETANVRPPQELLLQWIGDVQILEQQNKEMNVFIAELIERLRKADIYTLLVKGQGIAQCYEKPLWRTCGDVDFYLSNSNYNIAKDYLKTLATHVDGEDKKRLHAGMMIDSWTVELHGSLHSDFSNGMNKVLDEVHQAIFYGGEVRSWNDNGVPVFLPSADNDVIIVFTHFLQHFYVGGVGLRQICDWCRLLWTYRKKIDVNLLESRIRKAGLMTEWRAFAALAVEYLGMPVETMPLYSESRCYRKKAGRLMKMILKAGNFGHSINDESYRAKYSGLKADMITFFRRLKEFAKLSLIFPKNGPRFFLGYVLWRLK